MSRPENDPRLVELCHHAGRLFPGQRFFVSFVPVRVGDKFSSMANMPEAAQVAFLRALLRSFEAGTAARTETLELAGKAAEGLALLDACDVLRDETADRRARAAVHERDGFAEDAADVRDGADRLERVLRWLEEQS